MTEDRALSLGLMVASAIVSLLAIVGALSLIGWWP